MKLRRTHFLFFDIIFLVMAYVVVGWTRQVDWVGYWQHYSLPLTLFTLTWLSISILRGKYWFEKDQGYSAVARLIVRTNILIILLVSFVLFFGDFGYSRVTLMGSTLLTTILELAVSSLYLYDRGLAKTSRLAEKFIERPPLEVHTLKAGDGTAEDSTASAALRTAIVETIGREAFDVVDRYLRGRYGSAAVLSVTERFNIDALDSDRFTSIVNLHRINDIRWLNKFFESVNGRLPAGGLFIGCVETAALRKERILRKYPHGVNRVVYFVDFLVKRIGPKLWLTKKLYFALTRGLNRVIAKPEVLGRLYSCGFELVEEQFCEGLLFFVSRKVKAPAYDMNPTYGLLVKLRRHGRNGDMINVYKMRTMHPFAEYLQEYVHESNDLAAGGKFSDDFRITTGGRLMRKLWIDELPMLINFFKGELKLVGVRPLSKHYFSLYDAELQKRRVRYKPGLVPPFYADLPQTLDEIMDSEKRYLDAYESAPLATDWRYFWMAFSNIVFKRARSN